MSESTLGKHPRDESESSTDKSRVFIDAELESIYATLTVGDLKWPTSLSQVASNEVDFSDDEDGTDTVDLSKYLSKLTQTSSPNIETVNSNRMFTVTIRSTEYSVSYQDGQFVLTQLPSNIYQRVKQAEPNILARSDTATGFINEHGWRDILDLVAADRQQLWKKMTPVSNKQDMILRREKAINEIIDETSVTLKCPVCYMEFKLTCANDYRSTMQHIESEFRSLKNSHKEEFDKKLNDRFAVGDIGTRYSNLGDVTF